jgi:hypothetical protein
VGAQSLPLLSFTLLWLIANDASVYWLLALAMI